MAGDETRGRDVLVQVCLRCGTEQFFDEGTAVPDQRTCEKCGSTVFRSFDAVAGTSDVQDMFDESTSRDTATDAGAGDVTRGDLRDLERL